MQQGTLIDTTKMFNETSPVPRLPRSSRNFNAKKNYINTSLAIVYGIETLRTENTTIFASAIVMQFQINQTRIPSIVTFHLRIYRESKVHS